VLSPAFLRWRELTVGQARPHPTHGPRGGSGSAGFSTLLAIDSPLRSVGVGGTLGWVGHGVPGDLLLCPGVV
jgi:hypothetical protein